jgi:Rrf2 family protein
MKVSQRVTYGIMAAVDLAMNANEAPIQARAIARRQAIPIRFLEQVLNAMKKAGVVDSLRGSQGGYVLMKEPSTLSVADVLEALDGPVFHHAIQNQAGFDRPVTKQELLLGHVWEQVEAAERQVLSQITIEQLASRQRAMEAQRTPMYHI